MNNDLDLQSDSSAQSKDRRPVVILVFFTFFTIVSILYFSGIFDTRGSDNPLITVSFIAALIGGFLSLISPCSAAMLPVFFAYSFKEKRELVKMTFVFYLGLATLFVPLGFSASFIANVFFFNQILLFNIVGSVFIILGLIIFFGKSWQWLPQSFRKLNLASTRKSIATVYLMGVLFSFATGTCSAPIIGGILTLASTAGNSVTAILLLLTYAFGLVMPMFIIAWFFDRYNFSKSALVRGKAWDTTIFGKTIHIHSTNVITAVLFIGVGVLFILSRGTNTFLKLFGAAGLTDFYFRVNTSVLNVTSSVPSSYSVASVVAVVFVFGLWYIYKRNSNNK